MESLKRHLILILFLFVLKSIKLAQKLIFSTIIDTKGIKENHEQDCAPEYLPSMHDEYQMGDSPNGFQTLQGFYKKKIQIDEYQ